MATNFKTKLTITQSM